MSSFWPHWRLTRVTLLFGFTIGFGGFNRVGDAATRWIGLVASMALVVVVPWYGLESGCKMREQKVFGGKSMNKFGATIIAMFFLFVGAQGVSGESITPYAYLSPLPNATLVSAETTLTLRPGPVLRAESISDRLFTVIGDVSGSHAGTVLLAGDGRTLIFRPDRAFRPAETISITVGDGLMSSMGEPIPPASYAFTISPKEVVETAALQASQRAEPTAEESWLASDVAVSAGEANTRTYETLGVTFPAITITTSPEDIGEGYIFLASIRSLFGTMILDNSGEPVFYKPSSAITLDFKVQPGGLLTYFDRDRNQFEVMDNSYTVVDTIQAGNGYMIDGHDLQLLPNGNALFMIYDEQPVDMSEIVAGGVPTATVVGLVIQELDVEKNVVFEWRSWDHIPITDTVISLTRPRVDYVHGNAIEPDTDGNILISSRHLNEVTKINRQTGEIMWRLGGKQNEFTFVGDSEDGFLLQHDIRRLDNGNISIFDNRTAPVNPSAAFSRAVEYRLDVENKIAELVWQFRNTPDTFSRVMSNAQRLPNGNTVIGWSSADRPNMTEVTRDGAKAFEMDLGWGVSSYRFFRFPWQGFPAARPTLVAMPKESALTLHYSWNGATEIESYRIYGGETAPTDLVAEQDKTGYETITEIDAELAQQYCVWQVMPIDIEGNETRLSNSVFSLDGKCGEIYFPWISAN